MKSYNTKKIFTQKGQEDLKQYILSVLRRSELYSNNLMEYFETHICDNLGYCCRTNKSINEWKPDSSFTDQNGKGLNQKTVFLSARTFDLWEEGLVQTFNEELRKNYSNIGARPSYCTTHDLEIILEDEKTNEVIWKMDWEVKTTLGADDSFTGVTHGKGKCDNYILIKTELNKDGKISYGKRNPIVDKMLVIVWDNMNADWKGEPSNKSSFTSLSIDGSSYEAKPEILVLGKIKSRDKYGKRTLRKSKLELYNFVSSFS